MGCFFVGYSIDDIFKYKNTSKMNWIEQNQPRVMKLNQIVKIGWSKILGRITSKKILKWDGRKSRREEIILK